MATLSKLHISPLNYHHRTVQVQPPQVNMWDPIPSKGRRNYLQKCKCCKSRQGGGDKEMASRRISRNAKRMNSERGVSRFLASLKSTILLTLSELRTDEKFVEDFEQNLSSMALHVGRSISVMMSTGVVLLTGFQLSGGDGQMSDLIWYSWLGGIIMGTMIGSNMAFDEVSPAGPRNVVITGSTRGIGKALAREFLLSGDRVVVASRSSHESVEKTIRELEDSLEESRETADDFSRRSLENAEVMGVACDVSDPKDVKRLADFAVNEFGSIDIWINNAGTNKGFRPLLLFSDEDIQQIGEGKNKMLNCELLETVARTLVPHMRAVKGNGKAINYLTPPRILLALLTAWLCRGRWSDEEENAVYASETDRLRNWAESQTRLLITDAMESDTRVSVFSVCVIFAFIILSSTLNS
ncbi:probable chlorophyll(ide) b reductase NYC1, chloroplastic isoform X1 [Daucus carota subsp. sativus]|uniref:probable chlorophyll(ide) b reductase NYC1, chloroplastic isoform X1 n=1 Tax=Daucus carota subsp. sativus TaxID=79200 RepID=UPI0007F0205E|nr:PREDICTED: probable chlorophyll(ide) b reductase NYC1, chloroplastic isoform X1 [Daucus carota subsp. sativus]